jgi:cytochrome P450
MTVNFNNLVYRLTFDTMGEFAFAKNFGLLAQSAATSHSNADDVEDWHYAVAIMRSANEMLGPINPATWVVHLGNSLFPFLKPLRDFQRLLSFCQERVQERLDADESIKELDITSWLISDAKRCGMRQEDMQWLKGDSIAVVVAGSETTAATLIFLFYCLATHPLDAEKVYEEVSRADVDTSDIASVSSLPHLNGCINESQRLWPANPTFHPRTTGPEGFKFNGINIPGNTNVSAPRFLLGRCKPIKSASLLRVTDWTSGIVL